MLKLNLSFRAKITFLIAAGLLISGACFVVLGTRLIIQDKTSYIYDYAASQTDGIAKELSSILEPINHFAERMNTIVTKERENKLIYDFETLMNVKVAEIERESPTRQSLDINYLKDSKELQIKLHFANGRVFKFNFILNTINEDLFAKEFSLCILSPDTHAVLYGFERADFKAASSCQSLLEMKIEFSKGAQEVSLNHIPFIMSYDKIVTDNLIIASVVSKEIAFMSATFLIQRSLILGFTLLMLALGVSLIFLKSLTQRIDLLTLGTKEIASGNFDLIIPENKNVNDEISLLTRSFNLMSGKIKNLLIETASKAVLQKELEAAELVQKQFLPGLSFSDDAFVIQGISKSATVCGGDFWQFRRIGNRVFLIFGDITGHGMPAALLTAAVYGTFITFAKQISDGVFEGQGPELLLNSLSSAVHSAIFEAIGGESSFPCCLAIFDLDQNKFFFVKHGHPNPYLWDTESSRWSIMMSDISSPLGLTQYSPSPMMTLDFNPGFKILFYSDGLFDERLSDHKRLNKKETLKEFSQFVQNNGGNNPVVERMMGTVRQFFGNETGNQPDDITFVMIERKS